jgi:hypothetical protein
LRDYVLPRLRIAFGANPVGVPLGAEACNEGVVREFAKQNGPHRFVEFVQWLIRTRIAISDLTPSVALPQTPHAPHTAAAPALSAGASSGSASPYPTPSPTAGSVASAATPTASEQHPWFIDESKTPSHMALMRFLHSQQQRMLSVPMSSAPSAPSAASSTSAVRSPVPAVPSALGPNTGFEVVLLLDSTLIEFAKFAEQLARWELHAIESTPPPSPSSSSSASSKPLPPAVFTFLYLDNVWPLLDTPSGSHTALRLLPIEFGTALFVTTRHGLSSFTALDDRAKHDRERADRAKL